MRLLWSVCLFVGVMAWPFAAMACNPSYQIKRGDTLSRIAETQYRNAFRWTEIYAANREVIGSDPDKILVGAVLLLICLVDEGNEPSEIAVAEQSETSPLNSQNSGSHLHLRTGDGLPPLTDRSSPAGGFFVELMRELAANNPSLPDDIELTRVAWSSLGLRSSDGQARLWVFPVAKPHCTEESPTQFCVGWTLSMPVLEMLTVLYFRPGEAPLSKQARELLGRTVCRAAGLPVDVLDTPNRRWIRNRTVRVQRAPSTKACFTALLDGQVDAVLTNEFTGRFVIKTLVPSGLAEPEAITLGTQKMYAAVQGGLQEVEALNSSLVEMRRDGRFQALMRKHLATLWVGL